MAYRFVPIPKGPIGVKTTNSNTLADQYRESLAISYRFIGSTEPTIEFKLGEKELETPIMAGPIGPYNRENPDAIVEYAKAVADAGSVFWTGFNDVAGWQKVLNAGVPAIRVIKPLADNDLVVEEIKKDTDAGAIGYAMDIDHGMNIFGQNDAQKYPFSPKTFDEIRRFNDASELPFFLKGIQSIHDAVMAVEAGVYGIVISGHNNRFPCAVPPLKILPEIRKAVGDDLTILVDGGLNTGFDVFKAIALGANGTLCARNLLAVYAKEGAEGLTYKLREMTAELAGAMANTGSKDLKHITKDCIIQL